MADLKISELSALAGSNLVAADALAIVDDSASETKKITVSDLIANGVTVISDDTIPGAKILFGAGDIATATLADAAVTTAKVADDAITAAKLGNESTVDLVTTLPGAGAFTGQLAFDTDDNKLYIWDGSAWQSLKAAGSVNTVSGSTTGEINIVSSVSGDTVTLSATIDNTSSANQFLAGPTGAAGAVGYRVIDGSDLPVSTSSAKGGVIVNGEGLRMDASTIEVDNDVTASSTHHVVTYNAKGLITGGRVLAASDLPIATASAVGGVIASTGLTVDGSGNLTIDNSVTADTYTKVTVAATGLITAGSTLAASDLPNHSADLLTSGNIPLARIADNLVTGAKLADYASAKIGETNPTADYIGQLFFNPLTRDLSLWDGNVFQPIGISAGEIVFAGTYNATTNLLSSVTSDGTGAGFVVGQALPAASGTNKNFYVVVDVGGTGTSPAPAVALAPPDFVLSTGTEYKLIDVSETVTAQVASNVGFTPVGTIAANNVQTALAEVDTEKLAKSGGTMTGNLELNDANVVFEGSTENAFETTLTVVDPTADRTITLPNVTGAVVTTGDTGTVTSAMLTDGTIVNADINASAEIAVSKLANGTARQLLQTASNGSDVEFTSNVDVPGTLDVTGAATLDSTLDVAGLISADGKVSFPLGSASAPSLLPGADTNTGIFSPGADQLAITTGGTQRVTVDSSGNCGIGTSSPDGKLTLPATASNTPALRLQSASSNTDVALSSYADASGTYAALGANYYLNSGGNGAAFDTSEFSAAILLDGRNSGSIQLLTSSSGTASERLRIDASGRLGLGTSSPTTKLHVAGDVKVVNTGIAYLQPNTVTAFQAYESSGSVKISLNNNGGSTFALDASINSLTIGRGAGNVATNTAIGSDALNANTSGAHNTGVGVQVLLSNTTGSFNTGTGKGSLALNTTGGYNVANGYAALNANTTGNSNTAIGNEALKTNTTGENNTAAGHKSLNGNTTGVNNTALGTNALRLNTTANYNTATGYDALYNNTTGHSHTAVGYRALRANTTGYENAAIGNNALLANNTGFYNVGVGTGALMSNTTGSQNTAIGRTALLSNTTANNNTATGYIALYANTTGANNTSNGAYCLYNNTTGGSNTSVGYFAMYYNTTGSNNVAVGDNSLRSNTTGSNNTANGLNALYSNTVGSYNTANGYEALRNNTTASYNVATGFHALLNNTTGTKNVANGAYALFSNTTGASNTAHGYAALYFNTTGSHNTANGQGALFSNTTGASNLADGKESLYSNTTGTNNTATGVNALYSNTTSSNNAAYGLSSLFSNTTGHSNAALGKEALYNCTTGINHTAVGLSALYNVTTANHNTALGKGAGVTITTGDANVCIGVGVDTATNSQVHSINIGNSISAVGDYYFTFGSSGNRVYNQFNSNASWARSSDVRLKKDIQTNADLGLGFINDLRTVTYKWKAPSELDTSLPGYNADKTEADYTNKMYGFIAQEVKQALDDHNVTDFAGWTTDNEDIQGISYEMFVMPLVKSVQELTTMVNDLKAEVAALKGA